jgi:Lon protease-like protein
MPDLDDLGLFPLGLVLLPGERAPLHLFEPRYRQLLADCVLDDRPFVILQDHGDGASPIGCTARFMALGRRFADGRLNVTVIGESVVKVVEETSGRMYLSAWVEEVRDDAPEPSDDLTAAVHDLFARLVAEIAGSHQPPPIREDIPLSYAIAGMIEMPAEPKQDLLECRDEDARLAMVRDILSSALDGADRERVAAARARTNGKVALP